MPAFLFISGLFSKKTVQAEHYNWKKLVPYVVVCIILGAYRDFSLRLRNPDHGFSFYDQDKISWFMLALFASYSIAWLLRKVKPRYVFPVSILIGLAVGYLPFISEGFALSRIIVFFPFFYAGYLLDRNRLAQFLDRKSVRVTFTVLLLLWFLYCIVFEEQAYLLRRLFTGQNSYEEIPDEFGPAEFIYRGLAYLISAVAILGFFTLVPRHSVPHMTELGSRTLSVYFWHLPVLDIVIHTAPIDAFVHHALWCQLLMSLVFMFGLTYLFSWKPFAVPLNWLLNPWPTFEKMKHKQSNEE